MTTHSTDEKYLIRRLADTPTERGVCGWRKTLVTHGDTPVANVSHLQINDSKYHYHRVMTEFYYVLSGGGTMTLDGEAIELHKGVVVYIPRGVRHKAEGKLTILTVCIPAGVMDDIHEVE